jgi:hypothetical protein
LPHGYINSVIHPVLSDKTLGTIADNSWPGIIVADDNMGGNGIFATEEFQFGDFVCHYGGTLIDKQQYHEDCKAFKDKFLMQITLNDTHCYLNHYSSTKSSFGKMINHSMKCDNVEKKIFQDDKGQPVVILKAKKQILPGDEILHCYGKKYRKLPSCSKNCKKCHSKLPIA